MAATGIHTDFDINDFLIWCRSKPAREGYCFYRDDACAFYQYAIDRGIPDPIRGAWDDADGRPGVPGLPENLIDPLCRMPWRFGALADRVERQLAEQGKVS